MTKHWSNPVAIGGEAFLHFFLPEQSFFTIRASEATLTNGAVRRLLEQTEQNDGLHGFKSNGTRRRRLEESYSIKRGL